MAPAPADVGEVEVEADSPANAQEWASWRDTGPHAPGPAVCAGVDSDRYTNA